jgi:hypothetical protein
MPHGDQFAGTASTTRKSAQIDGRLRDQPPYGGKRGNALLKSRALIVDDENMILAGHGRLEGARLEGMAHVPIVRFGHLSEAQKRAYVIADNKIAEQAGWDRELLSIELGELIELLPIEELDISITGFETAEIDLLFADMGPSRPEPEDAIPGLPGDRGHAARRSVAPGKAPTALRRYTAAGGLRTGDARGSRGHGLHRSAL